MKTISSARLAELIQPYSRTPIRPRSRTRRTLDRLADLAFQRPATIFVAVYFRVEGR